MKIRNAASLLVLGLMLMPVHTEAQVTYDRILASADEPENWLTYNGTYSSQRYSQLDQIDRGNVDELEIADWTPVPSRRR